MNRSLNVGIPLFLFLFIMALLPYIPGFEFDVREGFQVWALYIHRHGLCDAYGATDYMPVFQYILWLFGKLAGSDQSIIQNICYLRCFTLAFDFLGVWYVWKWIDKKIAWHALLCICILNIAYTYDTLLWGQVDGILSALIFISIYYAYKGKNVLSAIFFVLAFNFKIQAIVILPLWGILCLYNIKNWKDVVWPAVAAVVCQVLIALPFTMGRYGIHEILKVAFGSFNKFQSVSIQASNMWHWFVQGILLYKNDATVWIVGLTYKQAGLLLFFIASLIALFPVLHITINRFRKNIHAMPLTREMAWLTGALLYLCFYFFNTEIHERYCQPAFIFITAYTFFTADFIPFILFSIMYFLTLEHSMESLKLQNYDTLLFDLRFIASLNAALLVYLYCRLYGRYKAIKKTYYSAFPDVSV